MLIARVDLKEGVGEKPEQGMSAVKFIYRSAVRVAVHGSRCSCVHARVAGLELPVSAVRVLSLVCCRLVACVHLAHLTCRCL